MLGLFLTTTVDSCVALKFIGFHFNTWCNINRKVFCFLDCGSEFTINKLITTIL